MRGCKGGRGAPEACDLVITAPTNGAPDHTDIGDVARDAADVRRFLRISESNGLCADRA